MKTAKGSRFTAGPCRRFGCAGIGSCEHTAAISADVRGVDATVSVEHLPRYLPEFDFRASTKRVSDSDRMAMLADGADGRRSHPQAIDRRRIRYRFDRARRCSHVGRPRYRADMAGSVARWPGTPPSGNGGIPPADIYKTAVDEYRFQAQYNWSRTQYLLGLNVAILVAGTAVASRPGHGASLVFGLGVLAALLSTIAVMTQHDYYRAARDHMRRIEEAFEVPAEQRLDTTSTLGGRRRTASVNQVVYVLLGSIAIGDTAGSVLILTR
jgi:hypothetical protein